MAMHFVGVLLLRSSQCGEWYGRKNVPIHHYEMRSGFKHTAERKDQLAIGYLPN